MSRSMREPEIALQVTSWKEILLGGFFRVLGVLAAAIRNGTRIHTDFHGSKLAFKKWRFGVQALA